MSKYDLLLKNTRVFDPKNGIDKVVDIAMENGKISQIKEDINPQNAKQVLDLKGMTTIPGIIDMHVHAGSIWGSQFAQKMLSRAGVCTALDMAGPLENVLEVLKGNSAGLNLAILQYASPPFTLKSNNPNKIEIEKLVDDSLGGGAYGVKLLGGHYPLTPESSLELIDIINKKGGYVAWHAGTTTKGSNIEGMRQAVECAGKNFLHLAHINSYCRGNIRSDIEEVREAVELLEAHPNIYSESYISPLNGTQLNSKDEEPISLVTRNCLKSLGFSPTNDGVKEAFLNSKVFCIIEKDGESVRLTGEEGIKEWQKRDTNIGGMFPVNPVYPRITLAGAKRKSGDFVVDCFSTDGGCIPRNVIVNMGLALVELDVISLKDFVLKTSWNPSRMLRLPNKGHLAIGMDADITVLDLDRKKPVATIVDGEVSMLNGQIFGDKTRIICTPKGEKALKEKGFSTYVADPSKPPLKISETR
ncbi:MAG: amidohydrolase family protein [Campylobacteraceae bacterium]